MATGQPVSAGQRDAEPVRSSNIFLALSLVATFLVYAPTLTYEFVSDDIFQIVRNPHLQSWYFLPRYFTSQVWSHAVPNGLGNYYRPVFLLWCRVNYLLFGPNPWGWHLTTIGAHLLVTLLVYVLVQEIAKDHRTAGLAALVFGLHPVHIESVAWVSGVTDPLLAMLVIPAFLCYLRQRESGQRRWLWSLASLAFYALGLLAKETAVVLPIIIFIHGWIFWSGTEQGRGVASGRQRIRAALRSSIPYFVLTAVYLIPRGIALKGIVHPDLSLPLQTCLLTVPSLLWFYMRHLLWPMGLSASYHLALVAHPSVTNFALPAVVAFLAVTGLALWSSRSPTVASAIPWLVLPIILVLRIQGIAQGLAHDRYLYLPSVGFSIIASVALRSLKAGSARVFGQSATQLSAALLVAGLLAFATTSQLRYWKNDIVLTSHVLEGSPGDLQARNGLGFALAERGRLDEAISLWLEILGRDPNYFPALDNLGYYHYRQGKFQAAEHYLLRSIEVNPSNPYPFLCLGLTRFKMGRLDEAEASMRHALELEPEGLGYHFALAYVLKAKGNRIAALDEFRAELANNPQNWLAREQIRELEANSATGSLSAPDLPAAVFPRP